MSRVGRGVVKIQEGAEGWENALSVRFECCLKVGTHRGAAIVEPVCAC